MKTDVSGWVTAKDLEVWSHSSFAARFILSRIVRHAVLTSTEGITKINFPSEEEVCRKGFDGILRAKSGNPWVPKGASYWELGTGAAKPPEKKAGDDYLASLKKAAPAERRRGTFVFVTTQSWAETSRKEWVAAKKALKDWKDVRVLDSSDLAQWLDARPPSAVWTARLIANGKCPPDVQNAATYWENLRDLGRPELTLECLLAGRDREAERLAKFLDGPPDVHAIHSDSGEEAIDFLAAFLAKAPLAFQRAQARCLLIETKESWRRGIASSSRGVIVPRGFDPEPELLREATRCGFHVILPVDQDEMGDGLRRLPAHELEQALKAAGYESSRAKRLARQAGGSSTVLKRLLVSPEQVTRPSWADPAVAPDLAGFVLVGAWQEANPLDRQIVGAISGISERDLDRVVRRWSSGPDRLFRKTEFGWRLASQTDAWRWLSRYVTKQHGEAFTAEVAVVLGWEDSRFDVPASQRSLAVHNDPKRYSPELRRALSEAFALAEVSKDESVGLPQAGVQPATWRLFDQLFPADCSTKRWATLGHLLPLLAEAMPEEFLGAVERDLSRSPSSLLGLFEADSWLTGSPHVSLVWALEILAWSPQYLLRAAMCLAALARQDPGGSTNPRPMGALAELFFPRLPQTNSASEFRLEVLGALIAQEPDVGWNLLLALLPGMGGMCIYNSQPRWRTWAAGWNDSPTETEIRQQTQSILDQVLRLAKAKPLRLVQALEEITRMPGVSRGRAEILEAVRDIDPNNLAEPEREALANGLRKVVDAHRCHPDAWWALPSKFVDELDSAVKRLEPSDPVGRLRWLFHSWPQLPGIVVNTSSEEQQRIICRVRLDALREIMAVRGLDGIVAVVGGSHDAWQTGRAAGGANLLSDANCEALLERLTDQDEGVSGFSCGYLRGQFDHKGWDWVRALPVSAWPEGSLAALALSLPFEARVWDWLASISTKALDIYWQKAGGCHRLLAVPDCERAVREWIRAGRGLRATGFLSDMVRDGMSPNPDLVTESLDAQFHQGLKLAPHPGATAFLGHEVAELLGYLRAASGVDHMRVLQFEWQFFLLLECAHEEPTSFFQDLEANPSRFVELVCLMYRPEGSSNEAGDQQAQAVAYQAGRLLEMWRKLPGEDANQGIEGTVLQAWCAEVGRQLVQCQCKEPGEFWLGRLLGHAPPGTDGVWPHEEVRTIIESWKSESLERGISHCRRTSYQPNETGISKAIPLWETVAADLSAASLKLAGSWRRTAALVSELARDAQLQMAWRRERNGRFHEEY